MDKQACCVERSCLFSRYFIVQTSSAGVEHAGMTLEKCKHVCEPKSACLQLNNSNNTRDMQHSTTCWWERAGWPPDPETLAMVEAAVSILYTLDLAITPLQYACLVQLGP